MLWIKLHAYLACFFLPMTALYIATGVLYLFHIEGGLNAESEHVIVLADGWPETEQEAEAIVRDRLPTVSEVSLHEEYYVEEGLHEWYGYKGEIILVPSAQADRAILIIKEHDLWKQLLWIHKGLGGIFFWVFSILFGGNLLFSIISGVVISLRVPKLKRNSLRAMLSGALVLVLGVLFAG
ncbi:hypothetical protein MIB92_05430 [Aestuariirhabdus sp. Z084]|uniref:hypothetical protein n=1 Tax=Aestuariirhabdus haliotis TaxID=2918751 RepID=UPI00201B3811|nr:hypothetical protein [Aestuariirhabdus haliotis]MCL6415083.1 hypothetical protein [Aestuariirhabdus haliotis]MCL6419015.1 hypothetical protein [Aestuariirhabdus haliotis]